MQSLSHTDARAPGPAALNPNASAHGLAAYLTGGYRLVFKMEDVPFIATEDIYCYTSIPRTEC